MSLDLQYDVIVVGAGASGTLIAAQFYLQAHPQSRLLLAGAGSQPARGVAYSTSFLANLLNVPAGNMSAFPHDREHFLRWLVARVPDAHERTFAPRKLYGDYLADILDNTVSSTNIETTSLNVIDIKRSDSGWRVYFQGGSILCAAQVILALGNQPPSDPFKLGNRTPSAYYVNPWAPEITEELDQAAPVLLLGSGLTMVDVALSLRESGHSGSITAISRHGRIPQHHQAFTPHPLQNLPVEFALPHTAIRWIRTQVESGIEWRAVIDSLRPHTATIWRGWNRAKQASFLRHARNHWDVLRHRMAPEIHAQIQKLITRGELTLFSGRLVKLEEGSAGTLLVTFRTNQGNLKQITSARVINCTGPERDFRRVDSPLINSLRDAGLIIPDSHHLGWKATQDGQLLGRDGQLVPGLYTIGPLRLPDLWESVAIPEIRTQAAELVSLVLSEKQQITPN